MYWRQSQGWPLLTIWFPRSCTNVFQGTGKFMWAADSRMVMVMYLYTVISLYGSWRFAILFLIGRRWDRTSAARMASGPAAFPFTEENTSHARLCRLLVDVGCTVLRDTFDSIHPPANLHGVLSSPSVVSTLQSLRKKRVLNPLWWQKLFPAVASTASSANFDVTLQMVLLRNICGLSPPVSTHSWDKLPPDSDNSMEANIVRIKCYRNEVCGHAIKASIDDATFNALWQKISIAILALGSGYGTVISKLKTECMDPAAEAHYQKLLSDWKKDDDVLKEMLGTVCQLWWVKNFRCLGLSADLCKLYYNNDNNNYYYYKPISVCCEEFHWSWRSYIIIVFLQHKCCYIMQQSLWCKPGIKPLILVLKLCNWSDIRSLLGAHRPFIWFHVTSCCYSYLYDTEIFGVKNLNFSSNCY